MFCINGPVNLEICLNPIIRKTVFSSIMAVVWIYLESLPENSVNMIFADPPYNLSNGGFSVHSGRRVDVHKGDWDKSSGADEDFAFHLSWIRACHRVLKPEGTIWISGTYHSIYQCGFALQVAGYRILKRYCMV